jgi:Tol biopolymer transport system component
MRKPSRLLSLIAIGILLLAGCGGDDDKDDKAQPKRAPAGTIVFKRYLDPEQEHGVIVTIKPDGSAEKQIMDPGAASDDEPGVSPDGRTVGFTRFTTGGEVWTAGIDGSRQRRLDPKDIDGKHFADERSDPAFSPDGSLIAFQRGWGEVDEAKNQIQFSDVYLMDTHGEHVRRLTTFTKEKAYSGDVGRASWSPDGKQLVISHVTPETESDLHELYIASVPDGHVRRLTPKSVRADDPDWSPDGKTILFRTAPPGENTPGGELYTIHPDGSGMKQLTRSPDSTYMASAAYSPDGKWIVFVKGVDGNEPDVYVMTADGSAERRITKNPLWESRPTWGP